MAESEHGKEIIEGLAELNAAIEANENLRGRFRVTELHGYHDVSDLYEEPGPPTDKDKLRLDWLDEQTDSLWLRHYPSEWHLSWPAGPAIIRENIRAAIDAVMERESEVSDG
jgi:hypothetical protein